MLIIIILLHLLYGIYDYNSTLVKYVNSVYVCTVDQNDHSLLTTNDQVVLSLMQAELVKTDTSWSPLVLWKCSSRNMLSVSSLVHYLKTKNIHVV